MITNYIYADVAESYRFPPVIERVLEQRARSASVLLGQAEIVTGGPVSSLVLGAASYVNALAVLPIDPEADHRIERLMAQQPKRGSRKPLPRK